MKVERRENHREDDHEQGDNEADVKTDTQNPLLSIYNYLVVLSIILIIFAAFRNSVTW